MASEVYYLPSSFGQQRIWIMSQFESSAHVYNIPICYSVKGRLNPSVLERSLRLVIDRHEILRTTFEETEEGLMQVVHKETPVMIQCEERAFVTDGEVDNYVAQLFEEESYRRFDLAEASLFHVRLINIGELKQLLFFNIHHIICELTSLYILFSEWKKFYSSILRGDDSNLPPLDIQFGDFSAWQRDQMKNGRMDPAIRFWEGHLLHAPPFLEMPFDRSRPTRLVYKGHEVAFSITEKAADTVREFSRRNQSTPFVTFFSIWAVLLARFTGQYDLVVGTPSSGRTLPQLEPLIGFFVNILPVRIRLNADEGFETIVKKIKETVGASLLHQEFPFEEVIHVLRPERDMSYHPVFQVMFNFLQRKEDSFEMGDATLEHVHCGSIISKFDISLTIVEQDGRYTVSFEYNRALFDMETIQRLAGWFQVLMAGLSEAPQKPFTVLKFITDQEHVELVRSRNDTNRDLAEHGLIWNRLTRNFSKSPGSVAVSDEHTSLSYQELFDRVRKVQMHFAAVGVQKGDYIGVAIDRSVEIVVLILAIFRSGAVYIPLDPAYPHKRLAFICLDAKIKMVITQYQYSGQFEGVTEYRLIEKDFEDAALNGMSQYILHQEISSSDVAYVIYTSGSTGNPKGVMVQHSALYNLLMAMEECPGINDDDTLLAVTSISFDISLLELLLPLFSGASVVIAAKSAILDVSRLISLMENNRITCMQATPSLWSIILDAGWKGNRTLKALVGGEALSVSLASSLSSRVGALWNMYGPTETTIWSLISRIYPEQEFIPIGKPIANTYTYVLDANHQLLPVGIPGILYIGGLGVSTGYLGRPDLTEEKFITTPFPGNKEYPPGDKWYRTDDIVKRLAGGDLMYLGRNDNQIKLRGFRIELGEIESAFNVHPHVKSCIVSVRGNGTDQKLVAYIISGASIPTQEDLMAHATEHLPLYMHPSAFVMLEYFPLTPNGKLDRNSLPEPVMAGRIAAADSGPVADAIESDICKIWEDVLKISPIHVDDNFFALGGASLECIRMVNIARKRGLAIKPEWVFEHPTVRQLSSLIKNGNEKVGKNDSNDQSPAEENNSLSFGEDDLTVSARTKSANMSIESIGIYLPRERIASKQIVEQCRHPLRFPMERVTGILERRRAAEGEFSLDLAAKAIDECLKLSRYTALDIDMVICCNISRYNADARFSFEPSSAARIKEKFSFDRAIAFDISNACSGIFTSLDIAESFLLSGCIRRALVVSGEYITHISKTAQKEIVDYLDSRIACLTVGDSGAAMIVEMNSDKRIGFHDLDLVALGDFSELCIGKASGESHGGVIMYTDAIRMAEAGHVPSSQHTVRFLRANRRSPESIQHIILHQTSSISLSNSRKHINNMFGREVATDDNFVDNVALRGNTATTSHFVALVDNIMNGRIKDGDTILFNISASGLILGNALYTLDDLPSRVRGEGHSGISGFEQRTPYYPACDTLYQPVLSGAVISFDKDIKRPLRSAQDQNITVQLLENAGRACIEKCGKYPGDIDLLIYAGIYRDQFIVEPSISTLVAGRLGINSAALTTAPTFAFDLLSGEAGFIQACQVASERIRCGKSRNVLIVTSDFDNNRELFPYKSMHWADIGGAAILSAESGCKKGFGIFVSHFYLEHLDEWSGYWTWDDLGLPYIEYAKAAGLSALIPRYLVTAINDLLVKESLRIDCCKRILIPSIDEPGIEFICRELGLDRERLMSPGVSGERWGTTAIPALLAEIFDEFSAGDIFILATISSGIQASASVYYA